MAARPSSASSDTVNEGEGRRHHSVDELTGWCLLSWECGPGGSRCRRRGAGADRHVLHGQLDYRRGRPCRSGNSALSECCGLRLATCLTRAATSLSRLQLNRTEDRRRRGSGTGGNGDSVLSGQILLQRLALHVRQRPVVDNDLSDIASEAVLAARSRSVPTDDCRPFGVDGGHLGIGGSRQAAVDPRR